jgi:HEAT repeat protein/Cdc6-like AAA superfamily ATPase
LTSQSGFEVARNIGRPGGRWILIARRWNDYVDYLKFIEQSLEQVTLPGLGQVQLDDSYVPLQMLRWMGEAGTGAREARTSLSEALETDPHVMAVGPAGTGKSALLRWQAIELARKVLEGGRRVLLTGGGPPPLPVYLPLTGLPSDKSLEACAADAIAATGFDDAASFLDIHLASGRTVLLFDDLDTLAPDDRAQAAERIAGLVARYPENRVVVATRDPADQRWLPGFSVLEVAGIDPARIETLAGRWGYGQVVNTSGFMQVLERAPVVRSLVARPGWLATALAGVAETEGQIRAFDVVSGFVRQLDRGDESVWPPVAEDLQLRGLVEGQASSLPIERRNSGLLQWPTADTFRFVHEAVQAFYAARSLADQIELLVEHASDPAWLPVIVLAIGHQKQPQALIRALLDADHVSPAARALAEMRESDEDLREAVVTRLLEHLGQQDREDDRALAISLAGLLGVETVKRTGLISPALAALVDPRPGVRRAAAEAVARLGDPSAIAPLLTALGDEDRVVRRAASSALAAFGDRTVQPLVRQLNVPDERLRRAAMRALAAQGSRAVAVLVPLLDASSSTMRSEASDALAGIGADAVPLLVEVLADAPPRGNRSETQVAGASAALTKIGRASVIALLPVYSEADPSTASRIVEIVQAIGEPAIDALGEILSAPEHPLAGDAAGLLGNFGALGGRAAPQLVRTLGDPRFELRWEARRSLRRIGADAMPALLETLDGEDVSARWEAAQILLSLPDPPVIPLIRTLTSIMGSVDVADRRRAVRALGSLSGVEVRQALETVIGDADPMVRRAAVAQLGNLDDPEAATLLVARWELEDDEETSLAILSALTELSPAAATPILIDALAADDAPVREAAVELLGNIGESAVVPLVEALNARPAEIDLAGALRVLDKVGAAARAGGHGPANLARTYHRMLVEPLEVDELVYLSTTIEWWRPAVELHRTFKTVKQFLEYGTLGGIGGAESVLDWSDEIEDWLRPAARRALRQLRMISQAVQYYNRGATRRSKEKGLLAAADRLNSLRQMVGELGEPHNRIFHAVAEHWNGLINEAIRELQGRAELDLEIRTEHVRIRDVDTAAVLVFDLVNNGEGLASNVQLSLEAEAETLKLESQPIHYLPPLGQGDRISSEYTVRQQGAGTVPITIEVRYDDPQQEGQTRRFNREVRFFVEQAEYKEIGTSPYIAGPPVKSREMFYGRQPTFNWIRENLSGTYQDNVLVLYGERRTGKTSVLYQMQHHLPDEYAFVLIDLQTIAYSLSSTSDLLYAMSRKLINGLKRQGFDLDKPSREDFAEHPIEEFEQLGEQIGEMSIVLNKRAVLIADEFDLLIEAIDRGDVSAFVFDCIRGLMQHQDGLSFIFAGAHALTAMIKNPRSILFNTALRRKVSFLERSEAERLIREPVAEVLWYDDLAVEKILRVTAGQPYFIQYICHEIVNLARRDAKNFVTLRDVDRALQTTVQETTGIIRHSYMSLSRDEQLALAALARITDDGRPFVSLEDIIETLRQDDLTMGVHDLHEVVRGLLERDFVIERGGGDTAGRQYGFAMELVRVWLEQNDEYTRLLEEFRG